jgi:hypothetical protein
MRGRVKRSASIHPLRCSANVLHRPVESAPQSGYPTLPDPTPRPIHLTRKAGSPGSRRFLRVWQYEAGGRTPRSAPTPTRIRYKIRSCLRIFHRGYRPIWHLNRAPRTRQCSGASADARLSCAVSHAPAAPHTAIRAMPAMVQASGTCEKINQPPSMAKAIWAYM